MSGPPPARAPPQVQEVPVTAEWPLIGINHVQINPAWTSLVLITAPCVPRGVVGSNFQKLCQNRLQQWHIFNPYTANYDFIAFKIENIFLLVDKITDIVYEMSI